MTETDNANVTTASPPPSSKPPYKRLTPAERSAIIAQVSSGLSQTQVAKDFGVSRITVSTLVNSLRKQVNVPSLERRGSQIQQLAKQLHDDSHAAIHASVLDRDDVHKAAGTGLAWLKGTGVLNGDGTTVNVFVSAVKELPADLRGEYLGLEDAIDVTPQPVDE